MSVSVVVPVHNGAHFLAAALESVIAEGQSRPLEIIVVDDGSTDDSAGVAAQFSGVEVLRQNRRGAAAARNVGIARSSGEFVAFVDADDRWVPGKLRCQLGWFEEHPACGVVLGQQRFVLDGVESLPSWATEPAPWLPDAWREQPRGQVPPMSMVARRDVFERVGGFDEGITHAEDVDWLARAIDEGVEIDVVPEVVLERRVHAGNLSNDEEAMRRGALEVLARRARRQRGDDATGLATISVIIASRDHGPLVGEAIESVLMQTHPAAELIVIDDGSSDDTARVLSDQAPDARTVRQPPSGASAARNLGAALASSSHLLFLDADDRLVPDALEHLSTELRDGDSANAVLGRTKEFVDGDDAGLGLALRSPADPSQARLLGAMLFPATTFRDLGGFDPDLQRGEGIDLQHRAAHAGLEIREIDAVVLERRLHAANGGLTADGSEREYLAVVRRAVERSRDAEGTD